MAEFQVRRGTKFKNASVQRHLGGCDSCGKWWCRLLAYCVLIYTRVRGSCSLRFVARKNISWVLCHRKLRQSRAFICSTALHGARFPHIFVFR